MHWMNQNGPQPPTRTVEVRARSSTPEASSSVLLFTERHYLTKSTAVNLAECC